MGSEWKPDDSFLDRKRQSGKEDVDGALARFELSLDRIFTSHDDAVELARHSLKKAAAPGWTSWQLPMYLVSEATMFFLQTAEPGAVLPDHSHDTAQVRVILSGSATINGIALDEGDWVYIPRGARYHMVASLHCHPCLKVFYMY
jgi:quercetin dioxygenase-like cupin family protein